MSPTAHDENEHRLKRETESQRPKTEQKLNNKSSYQKVNWIYTFE